MSAPDAGANARPSKRAHRPLLARRHWPTIIEAAAVLGTASLVTRLLPFKNYIGLGARRIRGGDRPPPPEVARIVDALADRTPFRTVCLQRGLALQWLLRRRGVDAVLHYGIQLPLAEEPISAHVWVSVDREVLLGGPQHQFYTEVMRYPKLES